MLYELLGVSTLLFALLLSPLLLKNLSSWQTDARVLEAWQCHVGPVEIRRHPKIQKFNGILLCGRK